MKKLTMLGISLTLCFSLIPAYTVMAEDDSYIAGLENIYSRLGYTIEASTEGCFTQKTTTPEGNVIVTRTDSDGNTSTETRFSDGTVFISYIDSNKLRLDSYTGTLKNSAGSKVIKMEAYSFDKTNAPVSHAVSSDIYALGGGKFITVDSFTDLKTNATEASALISLNEEDTGSLYLKPTHLNQMREAAGLNTFPITIKLASLESDDQLNYSSYSFSSGDLQSKQPITIFKKLLNGKYAIVKESGKYVKVNKKGYYLVSNFTKYSDGNYIMVSQDKAGALYSRITGDTKLKKSSVNIKKGKTYTIQLANSYVTDSIKKITYSTSDKKIAAVSKDGVVTGKTAGNAIIKAAVTFANGDTKELTLSVTVK